MSYAGKSEKLSAQAGKIKCGLIYNIFSILGGQS